MRCVAVIVLLVLLAVASSARECKSIEYLHAYETTPYVPCVKVDGGCVRETVYVSNYCETGIVVNPDTPANFTIPSGYERRPVTLTGVDPAECIEGCVFYNESLEWEKNLSCEVDCRISANNYVMSMRFSGVDFELTGRVIESENYVSPAVEKMLFVVYYVLPLVVILFLILQWRVYKTDKFVFDDYGLRNLLIIALTAVAYIVIVSRL